MANVDIQIGYKNSAWFTTNAALILKVGQVVYLEQTGTYKIGDGVTVLNVLSFLGAGSSITKTSDLINDGDDGVSHFITLNDLPSNLTLYATNAASDISTYYKLVSSITDPSYNTTAVDIPTGTITTTNQFIASLATSTNIIVGNPGVFNITTIGQIQKLTGTGNAEFYFEVWKRVAAGTETLITTSALTLPVLNSGYAEFSASALWNDGVFISTDRIILKFYATRIITGSDPTYQFQFGGLTPVRSLVPIPLNVTTSISQTITNGVTDKSPSEDAVYDALNNKADKANGLVSGGAITVGTFGANNVRVASAIWFITPNSYTTVSNTDFLVALSAAGLQRFVGFYGDNTNTITKVEGIESELASYPTTPVGTALIGYLLVTDSAASSTPDLSGYLLKSSKATAADIIAGTRDDLYATPLSLVNVMKIIHKDIIDSAPLTGTLAITLMKSKLIPANTFKIGDIAKLLSRAVRDTATGVAINYFYVNTINSLTGATLIGNQTGVYSFFGMERSLYIKSLTNTETISNVSISGSEVVANVNGNYNINIDWTVNQYIISAFKNAAVGDISVMSSLIIQKH